MTHIEHPNAEWFYGNEIKNKQEIAEKVIEERKGDMVDHLFSIFMGIAFIALSLIMATLNNGPIKCLGVTMFVFTSAITMINLGKFAKFKSEILDIGYGINRKNENT